MTPIKFVACQARCINQYKNQRIKVFKCCANISFNRQCLKQGIIPKYAKIYMQRFNGVMQIKGLMMPS